MEREDLGALAQALPDWLLLDDGSIWVAMGMEFLVRVCEGGVCMDAEGQGSL